MSPTRERLHHLIDALPEEKAGAVELLVEFLLHTTDRQIMDAFAQASEENEELDERALGEIAEAQNEAKQGRVVPLDEALSKLKQ